MGCNGTVGLSAGRRVAGGDSFWLRPHPELEFTLCAPATSGAQGGQDAAERRLIFLLIISIYSTAIPELAHKDQIQDGYRRSNKNEAAGQILSHYGRQPALGIRLQTIEALSKVEVGIVVEDNVMERAAVSSRSTPRLVLKGHMKNTSTLTELCTALDTHYSNMIEEILRFIRETAVDDRRLPADLAELGLLRVEGFAQLEFPVLDFQENDRFQIHRACCTRT